MSGEGIQEQRWKIATVRGVGGREINIYAYGRTLEEARKRAGSADAGVQLCVAEHINGRAVSGPAD
jgi:hypothetical protein